MYQEQSACLGNHTLQLDEFLGGLELALADGGYSLEWAAPEAEHAYASWETAPKGGTWLFVSDAGVSRQLAQLLAIHLGKTLKWFAARCKVEGEKGTLAFEAREITAEGKLRFLPSTRLDGENLEDATYGKAEDRVQQILRELIGAEDQPAQSHDFQLFRNLSAPLADDLRDDSTRVDTEHISQLVQAVDKGLVATIMRDAHDYCSLRVIEESGTIATYYMKPEEITAFKTSLDEHQLTKLLAPSIRRPSKKFRAPSRVYSGTEIEIRRLLAEMLGVDRFKIDIDRPLQATGVTREQFVVLMTDLAKRHRIPMEQSLLDLIVEEEHWATAMKKLTISNLASFIYDKSLNERQWDRQEDQRAPC